MDYKFFFFPWFLQPEYSIDADFHIKSETENYFNTVSEDRYFVRHYG